ncbi:hypothetical protein [Pseudomonas fluorescens]|uniref:hypothetical protein n=1 Tax=Pseudomonas fluorescens TaxID=294 RepID=UPI0009C0161C|nr:hypothetical protein [Pseudomonas fluorescens]
MKGRRKIKTTKWSLQAQLEVEAKSALAIRSKEAANRFLDAASSFSIDYEPIGRLAGGLCITQDNASPQLTLNPIDTPLP